MLTVVAQDEVQQAGDRGKECIVASTSSAFGVARAGCRLGSVYISPYEPGLRGVALQESVRTPIRDPILKILFKNQILQHVHEHGNITAAASILCFQEPPPPGSVEPHHISWPSSPSRCRRAHADGAAPAPRQLPPRE